MDSGDLAALRGQIDAIDREIVERLVKRAEVAHAIGLAKGTGPVYRPERERAVIENAVGRARELKALLAPQAVESVYREIISVCRAVEGMPSVAYLGPAGTFTEMAVLANFGRMIDPHPCESIDASFKEAESGRAGFAVVPVENSTEGSVTRTLDLLFATNLTIVGEVNVAVRHNLMSRETELSQIRCVTAHPQALAQCRAWLTQHLPQAELRPAASNAEAAVEASRTPGLAAVAALRAAEIYGLNVLAEAIQDDSRNRTRFLVLGRGAAAAVAGVASKTSAVFSVPNRAGCLFAALEPLTRHGVSMMRLESRPARNGAWDYNFFVDIEGHRNERHVAEALEEIAGIASFFKILGSYPQAAA